MCLPTILPVGSSEKMSSSISFYRLGDIAEISKGIWLNSKTAKNLSRDNIEEQYGVQKNDVVISRKMYSTGKKLQF